ncbi:MAG: hypothetical protein P4L99_21470 [Chthoniobacter sp.]|nr:hypothetical protein [Chthoniobacter sp.]
MKTIYAVAILLTGLTDPLDAQPNTAPPYVAKGEAVLAAREQRANLLRDEIKALDSRIETRGDALIHALASIGDSKDSRTKVARMKEDTIQAIRRNIRYYQTKRAALEEELRRPTLNLTEEQKRRIIAAFNERIEKRVGQILELLNSLPTHKDYERYTPQGSNWIGPTYALNEDYLQNQRLTTIGTRLRREIETGLRRSIARLEQNNRSLKAQLDVVPPSASPSNLTGEIAKNDALIADRHKQIDTILSFVTTPTRPIGQMEAIDFDRERNLTIAELREDFYTLFARYNALIPELCAINTTRAAIAAAKAQTRKKTPPAPPQPPAATPSPGEN